MRRVLESVSRRLQAVRPAFLMLAIACSLMAAACSNIDQRAASQLAVTGSRTATTLGKSIGATRDDLDSFIEGQYLLAGLQPNQYPPPSPAMLANVATIKNALSARAQVMWSLADTYTAFGALAAYDAKGETENAITGLNGTLQNYAASVPSFGPIAPLAAAAVEKAGGFFASEVQKRRLLAASEQISLALGNLIKVMNAEKTLIVGLQGVMTVGTRDVAIALFQHGIGTPTGIFETQIGALGLTYTPGSYVTACAKVPAAQKASCEKELNDAIINVVKLRAERAAQLQAELYAANLGALESLANAQQEFEKGAPPDVSLTALAADLFKIQAMVDELAAAKSHRK